MKFIKISLYSLLALVLLVIVAGVFFVVNFDANDYKTQISAQVKQQTGRELSLGHIKPSIFPWVGLELQQLALSNAQGFNDSPMLQVERVDVRIELLPLLKQEINVDTLHIYGLDLNLQKNQQGRTNWDDIIEKQQAKKKRSKNNGVTTTQVAEAKKSDMTSDIPLFRVNGLEIKNAQAHWDDAQLDQKATLKELNIESGLIQLGQFVPLKISALIQTTKPSAKVQLQAQANINFDLKTQQLLLNDFSLNLNTGLSEFDIDELVLNLQTAVSANLEKQIFSLPSMSLDIDAKGKAIPGGKITANLTTGIEANLAEQLLQLRQLTIKTLGLNVKSQFQVSQLMDAPSVKGHIDIDSFNPKKILSQLAINLPEMQGEQTLQSAAINFDIKAGTNSVSLNNLKLEFDESTMVGTVSVNDFAQPNIKYTLSLDKINLDAYLSPAEPADEASATAGANTVPAVSEDVVIDLPVEMLRSLHLAGSLNVASVKGFEQTITQLNIETLAEKGLIKITKLNAKILEGSLAASAQLDVRKNTPFYQFNMKGDGIEADSIVNPLLQNMLGESAVGIHGASYFVLSINTKGQTVNQLMANSHGDISFNANDAVMRGVDAEYFVRKAVAAYLQEKSIPVKEEWRGQYAPKETTAIKTLHATAIIRQGVIQNNDLLLDSARFKVTGSGAIDLAKQTLRYQTVVDVQPLATKTTAEKLVDVPMPVLITGSFSQPIIKMDKKEWTKQASKALTSKATDEAKQKVEQKKDEKVEELKNKLQDKLKGLFN